MTGGRKDEIGKHAWAPRAWPTRRRALERGRGGVELGFGAERIHCQVNVPSAPAAYSPRTVSNPKPEFPPVTTACFPVKLAWFATSRAVLEALNVGVPGFFDLWQLIVTTDDVLTRIRMVLVTKRNNNIIPERPTAAMSGRSHPDPTPNSTGRERPRSLPTRGGEPGRRAGIYDPITHSHWHVMISEAETTRVRWLRCMRMPAWGCSAPPYTTTKDWTSPIARDPSDSETRPQSLPQACLF